MKIELTPLVKGKWRVKKPTKVNLRVACNVIEDVVEKKTMAFCREKGLDKIQQNEVKVFDGKDRWNKGNQIELNSKNGNNAIKKLKEIEPARAVAILFNDSHPHRVPTIGTWKSP